jgi:hypothetical protein
VNKIGVIGAGPGGLVFCREILQSLDNVHIDLYVGTDGVGGLAANSREFPHVERYYHHIFKSDKYIIKLCSAMGIELKWLKLKTSNLQNDKKISSINGIIDLVTQLGLIGFLHLSFGVGVSKFTPRSIWVNKSMKRYLRPMFGQASSSKIWEPLLSQKFGPEWSEVDFVWLVSRIADRSLKLGFLTGGFGDLWAHLLEDLCQDVRVNIIEERVNAIEFDDKMVKFKTAIQPAGVNYEYAFSSTGNLLHEVEFFRGVECLILELDQNYELPFYWLNLLNSETNFTVMINHSLAMQKMCAGGDKTTLYLARYVDQALIQDSQVIRREKALRLAKSDIAQVFSLLNLPSPIIDKFEYNSSLNAQPVFSFENFSSSLAKRQTLRDMNLIVSDLWATFPHDRGQNYAVKNALAEAKKLLPLLV